jgi:hypothetical protein
VGLAQRLDTTRGGTDHHDIASEAHGGHLLIPVTVVAYG